MKFLGNFWAIFPGKIFSVILTEISDISLFSR